MKVAGILVEEKKFAQLHLAKFCALKRPDDVEFVKLTNLCDFQPNEETAKLAIPLDAIVHKKLSLSSLETYFRSSSEFYRTHEGTVFIDPVDSIKPILNRFTQYETMEKCLCIGNIDKCVFVPRYRLFGEHKEDNIRAFRDSELKFPILCKPLSAHGKEPAHEMTLFFNESGLEKINFPSVVQNFENHDGFLIKVYVIGQFHHIVTRPSIRNLCQPDHSPIYFNSHSISKEGCCSDLNEDTIVSNTFIDLYRPLLEHLVDCLRCNLHLNLFGFDVIVAKATACKFKNTELQKLAVIDLNIFPDYSCVPDYFHHLENLVREELDLPKLDGILKVK